MPLSDPLSDANLAQLEELAKAATRAPWESDADGAVFIVTESCCGHGRIGCDGLECCGVPEVDRDRLAQSNSADAAFIAAICNAALPLIARVKEQEAQLTKALNDGRDLQCQLDAVCAEREGQEAQIAELEANSERFRNSQYAVEEANAIKGTAISRLRALLERCRAHISPYKSPEESLLRDAIDAELNLSP